MRKYAIIILSLFVIACTGLTIEQIVAKVVDGVKTACGVSVQVQQVVSALTGLDLSKIDALVIANSICDQFKALQAANAPTVQAPADLRTANGAAPAACYTVYVNNKPITACK